MQNKKTNIGLSYETITDEGIVLKEPGKKLYQARPGTSE